MRAILLVGLAACAGPADPSDDTDAENAAPEAQILAPTSGSVVSDPSAVRLEGEGTDPEEGPLSGDALVWSSDLDGALGTGGLITVALTVGTHEIALVASDGEGATDRDTILLTVQAENSPPVPVILAPSDGGVVREGTALVLEGAADDPEDGALAGPSLVWASSLDGLWGTGGTLSVPAPTLGDHVVTLTAVDAAGAEASTSVVVTVAPVGANLAPRVTITAPLDGASVVSGVDVPLQGSATDPEDGAITSGLVWTEGTLGVLHTGNGSTTQAFAPGAWRLTLSATDSQGLAGSASVSITANPAGGNTPPEVTLLAPTAGATVYAGSDLVLRASATDAEDGALPGSALAWGSSLDGALGTGGALTVQLSAVGRHALTVTATDGDGAVDLESVDVFVLAQNLPPVVQITQPAGGSRFLAGTSVRFAGTALDPEDGALAGPALTWTSSLQGTLGSGSPLDTASLIAGTHTVGLAAVDTGGRLGSAQVQIVVDPAPVNLVPVAVLSGAPTASVDLPWTADASSSSDPDGSIVQYTFDWGDGTTDTVGAAATATHAYASAGTYTVTLLVTDDEGATDDATLDVVASIPPRVPEVASSVPFLEGAWCAIALDAQERPWVLYQETDHQQVWLARRSSTRPSGTWTSELVEGPGFQVGGFASGTGDVLLDAAGVAHLAYRLGDTVRYAQRATSGAFTIETVGSGSSHVALALDASASQRPTVAYSFDDGARERLVVARRTGPAAWTSASNTPSNDHVFSGAWFLRANGTGGLIARDAGLGTWIAVPWTGSALGAAVTITQLGSNARRHHAAPAPDGRVVVPLANGVWTLTGSTWSASAQANDGDDGRAVGWDAAADAPVVSFRNEAGELELQRAVGTSAWSWDYQGPMDDTSIDLALEADGDARVCFFRGGRLVVY